MMSKATTKARRLRQVEMLLMTHPEGMAQAELARRLGVNRSTIHRDLVDLAEGCAVYEGDDGSRCPHTRGGEPECTG